MAFSIGRVPRKRGQPFHVPLSKGPPEQSFFSVLPFPFPHPSSYIASLLMFAPSTPMKQEAYIQSFNKPPMFQRESWSSHTSKELREAVYKINGIRWKLRTLLHKWRFSSLLPRNEEDIVSGEAPKHPVYIVDWNGKQMWVYEASTLMSDITNRLMNHDCFFEDAQTPRNPLTNLPLTLAQKISVWNQFSSISILHSTAFVAYRSSRFHLGRFIAEHKSFLLLHALRQSMRVKGDPEVDERLLDFIRFSHDYEAQDYQPGMYTYLLRKHSEHQVLLQWRACCSKYYECDILYAQTPDNLIIEREKVLRKTILLIDRSQTLRHLWIASLNCQQ